MIKLDYISGATVVYPPGATFAERQTIDFEFVWILRGNVTWHAQGRDIEAPPGTMLLSQPGMRESYTWDPHGITEHKYFHFNLPRRLPSDWGARSNWPLVRHDDPGDILRPLFSYLVDTCRGPTRPGPSQCRALETLLSIYIGGPQKGPEDILTTSAPRAVHEALTFAATTLRANPAAQVELKDLAAHASVTPQYLCKLFRQHVGESPMHVLLMLRLQHAVDLLSRTDFKLERIARECGFATAFHFSRRFSQIYSQSPSAMRAALRDGRPRPSRHLRFGGRIAIEY